MKQETLKELEKNYDKILIDLKDTSKIFSWAKTRPSTEEGLSEWFDVRRFFPLSDFVLEWQMKKDFTLKCFIQLNNYNPVDFTVFLTTGTITCKRMTGGYGFEINFQNDIPYKTQQEQVEYAQLTADYCMMAMLYIYEKGLERRKIEKESIRKIDAGTGMITGEKVYHDRELYFLKDIIIYVSDHPTKKSIQYLKDVWGVRGHLRHLQNEDIIFIKPFKKDRMRLTKDPESKTYLLENGGLHDGQSET